MQSVSLNAFLAGGSPLLDDVYTTPEQIYSGSIL